MKNTGIRVGAADELIAPLGRLVSMYLRAHCCRSCSCNHAVGLVLVTTCMQCTNIACLLDFTQAEQQLDRGPWSWVLHSHEVVCMGVEYSNGIADHAGS